jgi:hypothetical protein
MTPKKVLQGFVQIVFDGIMMVRVLVKIAKETFLDLGNNTRNINIIVVIDIRLQGRMPVNVGMPDTIYGNIVKLVPVIVLQEKIQEILNRSPLYGRNG